LKYTKEKISLIEEAGPKPKIEQLQACMHRDTKEERINCMFDALYKITSEQDILNIGIIRTLDDDTDPRWEPLHMIDKANAIILGISRNKGNPQRILKEGYVEEKVDRLSSDWRWILLKYGD